jgi:hypothetical protein
MKIFEEFGSVDWMLLITFYYLIYIFFEIYSNWLMISWDQTTAVSMTSILQGESLPVSFHHCVYLLDCDIILSTAVSMTISWLVTARKAMPDLYSEGAEEEMMQGGHDTWIGILCSYC